MIENKKIIVPTELRDVKLHQMITYNGLKPEMDDVSRQLQGQESEGRCMPVTCSTTFAESD